MKLSREEVVARRVRAQELDRDPGTRVLLEAPVLDLGVQDTGRDGASWALANRGVATDPDALAAAKDLALVWTLRASPHFYRRAELADVRTATSPFSDVDAGKRLIGADRPLREAGIGPREGLAEVARQLRAVVDQPRVKGEVSTLLTARLAPPYLRDCRPCDATHAWEVPFRLAALYAGLELEPATSPPVLRPIPRWPDEDAGPAADPEAAAPHLHPVRGYLRFLGPATPQEVADFLDAPAAEIKRHWPADAVEVDRAGTGAWLLPEDPPGAPPEGLVRLLGPYDLLGQGRDRATLVPDRARRAALWPTIGRPGAVLVDTDVVGSWRPRASGGRLSVRVTLWQQVSRAHRTGIGAQAEALAEHRGVGLAGVDWEGP